jgi:thiamine-phosphate pyrophosphorylase
MISVNGDTSLAAELDIGIHLGFRSIAPDAARSLLGSNTVIGYSAHADTHLSMVSHCHYVTFSPVYPVEKALALEPLGLERFAHMTAISPVPVFALGAITPERVADCLSAGAYGIAVLSGVMGTEDAVEAAGRYIEALDDAIGVK